MTLASLPMYDRPEMREAHDRLWQEIRARLCEGPEALTRGGDLWDHWLSPGLVLSQTCGLPYRTRLFGQVAKVASPDNRLPDCPPGHYFSIFVVRADDPRRDPAEFANARLAINESVSQSGWGAPFNHAREHGFAFAHPMENRGACVVGCGCGRGARRHCGDRRADMAALSAARPAGGRAARDRAHHAHPCPALYNRPSPATRRRFLPRSPKPSTR